MKTGIVGILLFLFTFQLVSFADNSALSSESFQAKVEAAGGRVDFVFEDDRPFEQCHASTLVQAANGDIFTAWFAGTKEKHPDVGIWFSHFDGQTWSTPDKIAKVNETAHWNPVLFRDVEDMLYLFFKIGPEIPYWQTYWMQSEDNGATWSEPVELLPGEKGGRGPVRSKPIILSDGAWLAPASTELGLWKPFADRTDDRGKTWSRSYDFEIDRKELKGSGAIQPTFWEYAPAKVAALLRTQAGKVWRTDSRDGGKTWKPVEETDIPNNNSGIDTLKLDDDRLLLIYNPVGKNWGARTPLDLALSRDNGKTWETIAHIEDHPDPDNEFSYPSLVRTKDGIALCYTWQRQRVRCWQIPLSLIPE